MIVVDSLEVEPASMASSIGVDPKMDVVLPFGYFGHKVQIPTLEVPSELDTVLRFELFFLETGILFFFDI